MNYKRYRTNIGPESPAVVINVKLGKYTNCADYDKAFISETIDITLRDDLKVHVYEESRPGRFGTSCVVCHMLCYYPELACTWHGWGPPDSHWWITPAPFNVNKLWDDLNV
jgi:hypothetical protein